MTDKPIDFKKYGIEKRFEWITFDAIKNKGVPIDIAKQYNKAAMYAENLEANIKNGTGLLLRGGVGTLKTSLSIAIMRRAIDLGYKPYFVPMVALMNNLLNAPYDEKARLEKQINTSRLLILDDMGGEYKDKNGWLLHKVDYIITTRYNKGLSTIITTNYGNKELAERYNQRILDRIKATCEVITFRGKSQREAKE